MPRPDKEIRDPIHGFVKLTPLEQDIIDVPAYQRLRRIRQLALTDMVYPAANHTRFEHSLGVLHVATLMFNQVRSTIERIKPGDPSFTKDDLDKARAMVRMAALLHDVGHAPFSHAGEDVMPNISGKKKRYDHEDYSAAIIRHFFTGVIDKHPYNVHGITCDELCAFLGHGNPPKNMLFWRELIKGQMDADRADYLLRDSHHAGVAYGRYDLHRLISTLTVAPHPENEGLTVAVEEGGIQAVEGLIIARYMMFTQVYFHHTRRAYDHHITEVLKCVLQEDCKARGETERQVFRPPETENDQSTMENLARYLAWTDPVVWDLTDNGRAGLHGELIRQRKHDRVVARTTAVPTPKEVLVLQRDTLPKVQDLGGWLDMADGAWYKFDRSGIYVTDGKKAVELPNRSAVVKGLEPVFQARIYVPLDSKEKANTILQ
jgi:HD superfamily phosphohydrolase